MRKQIDYNYNQWYQNVLLKKNFFFLFILSSVNFSEINSKFFFALRKNRLRENNLRYKGGRGGPCIPKVEINKQMDIIIAMRCSL